LKRGGREEREKRGAGCGEGTGEKDGGKKGEREREGKKMGGGREMNVTPNIVLIPLFPTPEMSHSKRTIRPSDYRTFGLSNHWTIE
jgi:hypothetical protein